MKILLILLGLSTPVLGGYTKEHIEESCNRYISRKIRVLYEQVAYFQDDGTWFFNTYIHAGLSGLREFECKELINQLKEDHP